MMFPLRFEYGPNPVAPDPLMNILPGSYPPESAGYDIWFMKQRIGSGQITTTSIVAQNGDFAIFIGDAYKAEDGRGIGWTDVSAGWPDLTGATVMLVITAPGGTLLSVGPGTISSPGTSHQGVSFDITSTQTEALLAGFFAFHVQAVLADGDSARIVVGQVTVRQ